MPRYGKPALLDQLGSSHGVIEASAGTGKTYTLEHLVVQLILEGIPLEQILVVTFTHKATLELISRVRSKLQELVLLGEDKVREGEPVWDLTPACLDRLRAALMGFDRCTISTIHGFCQQVLRDAAFEGGRLFQQEAVAAEDAFAQAFTHLLRTDFSVRNPDLLEVALGAPGGLQSLRKLLQDALKEAEGLDLPDFRDVRSFLEGFPQDLAEAFLRKEPIRAYFPKNQTAMGNRLQELLDRRADALASQCPADFWADSAWLKGSLQKDLKFFCLPGLEGEGARLAQGVRELADFQRILVAAFLPSLQAELARRKTEEGLYDFDDMIRLVAEALEGPGGEGLVLRLRGRFRAALIDEFQDTDARQWRLFRKIFLESEDGHRLFLVGDPKQAIYGFRSGDLPTYLAALAEVQEKIHRPPLQLSQNFRSTPRVIQACNLILRSPDGGAFFTGANAQQAVQPVTCGKPGLRLEDAAGQELPAVQSVEIPAGGNARQLKLRTARALAVAIQDTLARGRFRAPGRARPELGPEDVFVLTRTLREGRWMVRALREVGIPAAFYRQDGLFEGPEAPACRDLLLAIASPSDPARRAKALLGPFFGLSWREAEGARELPEGHPLLVQLSAWQDLARKGRTGELLSRLVAESGVSLRLLFLEDSARSLTNLLHILELLQHEALQSHRSLEELAMLLQRWIDGEARPALEDGETQRLERQGGAVQILTMHKSKGLQAPVVALFGGLAQSRPGGIHRYHQGGTGARRAWVGSLKSAPPEIQAWIQKEEQEEGERLAYVAMTRAEAQLILPCYRAGEGKIPPGSALDGDGHPKGLYRTLNVRLRSLLPPGDLLHPEGMESIPEVPWQTGALPESTGAWHAELPPPLDRPDFQALRRQGRSRWLFSFTGLHQSLDRSEEEGALEETKEPPLSGGPRGGKLLGTQVHRFMEQVDPASFLGASLSAWAVLPSIVELAESCLPEDGRAEILRWAYQAWILPLPLSQGEIVRLVDAEELLRELDFVTPYPGSPDLLTGSLDLLFQAQGRAWVLDWKTNRLEGYGAEALEEAVQRDYLLQVKIYAVTACRFLEIRDAVRYEQGFGGVIYLFLRGLPEEGLWICRPSWEELQAWEQELEDLHPERLIPVHAGGCSDG